MSEKISRRHFLQASAVVLVTAALTACGGGGGTTVATPSTKPVTLGDIEITVVGKSASSGGEYETAGPLLTVKNISNQTVTLTLDEFAGKVNGMPAVYQAGAGGNLFDAAGKCEIKAGETARGSIRYGINGQTIEQLEITITHAKKKVVFTSAKGENGQFSAVTDA